VALNAYLSADSAESLRSKLAVISSVEANKPFTLANNISSNNAARIIYGQSKQ
jgi:hypothetical protein